MLLRLAKHWMMTALVPSMLTVVRSAVTVSVRLMLKIAVTSTVFPFTVEVVASAVLTLKRLSGSVVAE